MRERNLTIRTNGTCQYSGATQIIMECVLESNMSWEDKQKMSLCRMGQKVMYRDNMYDLKGTRK